ncbi:MAG TPA: hypothetical protein VJA94_20640 [Candidatus Angelobacter sp.]
MKQGLALWFAFLAFVCPAIFAQQSAPSQSAGEKSAAVTGDKEKNIQEYVNLLRSDVRKQKAEVMGTVMQLDPDQAAKFWPIYKQYDAELTKLNDLRVANIQDYANNYTQLTDVKADQLIKKALDYRRQRAELLAKYYERVKASLGAIQAARFVQIEDQLLQLIDLQIESALPLSSSSREP